MPSIIWFGAGLVTAILLASIIGFAFLRTAVSGFSANAHPTTSEAWMPRKARAMAVPVRSPPRSLSRTPEWSTFMGTVAAVTDTAITVETVQHKQLTVLLDPATKLTHNAAQASLRDLKIDRGSRRHSCQTKC